MFIKVTSVWGNLRVLNSAYIAELVEGSANINGKDYPIVRIYMHNEEKHEVTEKLSAILKTLAGTSR